MSAAAHFFKSGWRTQFEFKKHVWGVTFETPDTAIAFGNRSLVIEDLKSILPDAEFHRLKQTHSATLQWSSAETKTIDPFVGPSKIEGDALATESLNVAVGVSTADCIPLAIVGGETVSAIHAGWKGVQNEIILKSLNELKAKGFDPQKAEAFIGPHILRSSFEVDKDLAESFQAQYDSYLAKCLPSERGYFHDLILSPSPVSKHKAYVDLLNIARLQLCLAGLRFQSLHFYLQDTKTTLEWASFRREGANMGKNLTFVSRRTP